MRADPTTDGGRPTRLERALDRVPFLEKELLLLRWLVRPGDRCVDIGAAGGAHLLVMAAQAGPAGRVLGVEPRPRSFAVLRHLVRLAGLGGQVTLAPVALGDRSDEVDLRVPVVPTRAHLRGSTGDPDAAAAFAGFPARRISVPTRRLDDVVTAVGFERVDVLKCDVEGAELLVLSGATRVLTELRPIVVIEADDLHQQRFDATAQDVLDAIAVHGYQPYRYLRGRLLPVSAATAAEDDYVLVPDERTVPAPGFPTGSP